MVSAQDIANRIDSRISSVRDLSLQRKQAMNAGEGAYSASVGGGLGGLYQNTATDDASLYRASAENVPFTSILPIASKVASQPIHVGWRKKSEEGGVLMTKAADGQDRDDIEQVESHAFLDALDNPNDYDVRFSLLFRTAWSLRATGKAIWWLDDKSEPGRLKIFYFPSHWAKPEHEENRPFARWRVCPPNVAGDGFPVEHKDIVYFAMPDAANPLKCLSALRSQAKAVNLDHKILAAQSNKMDEGIRPSVVIRAGTIPSPGGGEERMELTAKQRTQLMEALKAYYSGTTRDGEPFIVDRLIESIDNFGRSPQEFDFGESSMMMKNRIQHGQGVNPIVTGQVEGANRASAAVAQEIFYSLVVNPMLAIMSQTLTRDIGMRYPVPAGRSLHIWFEPARARDEELKLKETQALFAGGTLTLNEARQRHGLPRLDDPAADLLPAIAPPQPPPEVGTQRAAASKQLVGGFDILDLLTGDFDPYSSEAA